MSLPPKKLTAAFVSRVRPQPRVKAYGDGRGGFGLTLHVHPTGVKSWQQRILINGRQTNIGLGKYPAVPLAHARATALDNVRLVRRGGDPRRRGRAIPTVVEMVEKVIARDAPTWRNPERTAQEWRDAFRRHASDLGQRPVDEVTSAECTAVLGALWNDRRDTASKLRQRLSAIFKLVVAEGRRDDNPVDAAYAALPNRRGDAQRKRHHAAVPHGEVAAALEAVDASDAWAGAKLALRFLVLTAARSGEVRGADWGEIDLGRAVWTVPAERMKAGVEHRVPLSTGALDVVRDAAAAGGSGPLLFPTVRGKRMYDNALSKLLRDEGVAGVPHGFRSSFRDWAAERTDFPRTVVEAALAHRVADRVEAAYFRSDLFDRRRDLMQAWSDYLSPAAERAGP